MVAAARRRSNWLCDTWCFPCQWMQTDWNLPDRAGAGEKHFYFHCAPGLGFKSCSTPGLAFKSRQEWDISLVHTRLPYWSWWHYGIVIVMSLWQSNYVVIMHCNYEKIGPSKKIIMIQWTIGLLFNLATLIIGIALCNLATLIIGNASLQSVLWLLKWFCVYFQRTDIFVSLFEM